MVQPINTLADGASIDQVMAFLHLYCLSQTCMHAMPMTRWMWSSLRLTVSHTASQGACEQA